jgi:hypothetical protein
MITINLIGRGVVRFVDQVLIGRDTGRFGYFATGQFLANIILRIFSRGEVSRVGWSTGTRNGEEGIENSLSIYDLM